MRRTCIRASGRDVCWRLPLVLPDYCHSTTVATVTFSARENSLPAVWTSDSFISSSNVNQDAVSQNLHFVFRPPTLLVASAFANGCEPSWGWLSGGCPGVLLQVLLQATSHCKVCTLRNCYISSRQRCYQCHMCTTIRASNQKGSTCGANFPSSGNVNRESRVIKSLYVNSRTVYIYRTIYTVYIHTYIHTYSVLPGTHFGLFAMAMAKLIAFPTWDLPYPWRRKSI